MPDGRIRRLVDWICDLPLVIALSILDRLAGPMPRTAADEIRERQHERLRKAFPGLDKHI